MRILDSKNYISEKLDIKPVTKTRLSGMKHSYSVQPCSKQELVDIINTRIDNVLILLRNNYKNFFNNDFSALSALDDIEITVPRNVYKIIKNPWNFLNEEEIFSGENY